MILSEEAVGEVLQGIGLDPVAKNHVMRRPDGTAEGEVDLVFTYGNYTFVVEVSANAQGDARRRKRKMLREWVSGGRLATLSSELGLPESNVIRTVYVDLSGHTGMAPGAIDGGIVLGEFHMAVLIEAMEEGGLEHFFSWNGLQRARGRAAPCRGRGRALRALGRHGEALAAYDRAADLDPGRAGHHTGRGRALRALGRHGEARASHNRAFRPGLGSIQNQDVMRKNYLPLCDNCGKYVHGGIEMMGDLGMLCEECWKALDAGDSTRFL